MLVGAEVHEQLVDVVENLARTRVGPVDLVDRDDDREPASHRLLEHVAGLRQGPLGRVNEQQHRVDHQEAALDLATEVGVTRGIDDVEAGARVIDRRLLRQDRDALLALEIARVHHAIHHGLVRAEGARLPQHGVDQRGLAVVDVRHDRHVPEIGTGRGFGHGGTGHAGHGSVHGRTSPGSTVRAGPSRRLAAE